jgi:cell division protein ZapA
MKQKFGQVGDDRLILMAALMVTDELWDLRRQVQELKTAVSELRRDRSVADESAKSLRAGLAEMVGTAAGRLETMTERFATKQADAAREKPKARR